MVLLCLILVALVTRVASIVPNGQILFRPDGGMVNMAVATWAKPFSDAAGALFHRLLRPTGDATGCDGNLQVPLYYPPYLSFDVLLSRGTCSFYDKALAAKAIGASGVIVYNSLQGIYGSKTYAEEIEYDCNNGAGWILESSILSPPYDSGMNDIMPTVCTDSSSCSSGRCVLTNTTAMASTSTPIRIGDNQIPSTDGVPARKVR